MSSLAECLKGFEAGKDVKAELRSLARKYAKTMPKEDAEKRAAAESVRQDAGRDHAQRQRQRTGRQCHAGCRRRKMKCLGKQRHQRLHAVQHRKRGKAAGKHGQ